MKEFFTEEYVSIKKGLEVLAEEFNQVLKGCDKVTIKVIEGKTLHDINNTDVAFLIKNVKVQHLPAFTEMLAVGVDLRQNVKLSAKESGDLNDIKMFLDNYNETYKYQTALTYLQYIQILKGKAIINGAGIQHIERQKIVLNKKELELWNRLEAVINFINKDLNCKFLLYQIFSDFYFNNVAQQTSFDLTKFKNLMQQFGIDKK